jgi:hypothetical protein
MTTLFSQLNLSSIEHVWIEYHVGESLMLHSVIFNIYSVVRISKKKIKYMIKNQKTNLLEFNFGMRVTGTNSVFNCQAA